ncbi:hypothetical protein Q3H58_005277 [Pseudomonas psychrotolerans]|nr:hypothetical protein [Pseudomonas psychrotolerans]
MSRKSTRKLLVLSAGFALLVAAALLTTHKTDSESSEPAVVATTTPPVAAHAPTTGTHSVTEVHKQDLDSFIAQSNLTPCPAPMPKTITGGGVPGCGRGPCPARRL